MEHFQGCVSVCGMEDVKATGGLFTWSNKQMPGSRIYSRLDRMMGNLKWMEEYGDYMAHFHPEGIFDHSPCTLSSMRGDMMGRRNFKYFNMWGRSDVFIECVGRVWSREVKGTKMFRLVKKLKWLKGPLKEINKTCFSDIENSTNIAMAWLDKLQLQLQVTPDDLVLVQQEYDVAQEVKKLVRDKDSYLSQKAKLQWDKDGDTNSAYFHHVIKRRVYQNKVLQIEDQLGQLKITGDDIQQAFLDFYQSLLGSMKDVEPVAVRIVQRGKCCTEEHASILLKAVTKEEVRQCLFSIPKDKSPGPDGYTSQFFKDAWSIVGDDVCDAVINVFETGQLLEQINSTTITLIPKIDRPTSVKDFRPIACCNVIYKTISKLICNRLALILPDIISRNHGAFIQGRSILENILICQDLVRHYHRGKGSPRCMIKLDLQKAYDSIEWCFIDDMLEALKVPESFKRLVMKCVTSPSYSLSLNGMIFGFFKGKRGIRQGDPLSPLLFTICMEYLSRILDYAVQKWTFRFHPLCKELRLTHLLFADDLLLFSKGDVQSMMVILRAFATFSGASGLIANSSKTEIVFGGVAESVKTEILQVSGYTEGKLPFRYLGVPIQPGCLKRVDCRLMVDKVVARVRSLGARRLSYAGRLALINSVLNSVHCYWASIFLIPQAVIHRIVAVCRNFLWDGGTEYHRVPLVAWDTVCNKKKEGGLNVKQAGVWNMAMVGKLVDWIHIKADRLWVLWIDHVYLKGENWFDYTPARDMNWNWRNICKIKERMKAGYDDGIWQACPKGYTVQSGYRWLRGVIPKVRWFQEIWDQWNVPKHAFVGWLIKHRSLNTREHLCRIGVCNTNLCVLCEQAAETHDHLFSECVYSKLILVEIQHCYALLGRGSIIQKVRVCNMIKLAVQYYIWEERNRCRLEMVLARPASVVIKIKQQVRRRIRLITEEWLKGQDSSWLHLLEQWCRVC